MTVKTGQLIAGQFVTRDADGYLKNADALPAGTLVMDAVNNAAVVTIANVSTGVYSRSVTLPALTAGQTVQVRIAYTVDTVTSGGIVWQDMADTKLTSDLVDPAVATIQSGLALQASVDDLEGRLTATRAGYLDNLSAGAVATASALSTHDGKLDTVDNFVDDLEGRLTSTRAGYLDNLSAGAVPTAAQIATAVWAASVRTLSSFGTLVADVATAVWATTTRTLSSFGTLIADIWAYASRTLTQSGASVAATVAGTTITAVRGDTFSAALTNLGAITGYLNIWFTVKLHDEDTDAESVLQLDSDHGLLYANGATATAANGSIAVDDIPTGDITVKVAASVMATMQQCVGHYDVQWQNAAGEIYTLSQGIFQVTLDQTRAVA